VLDFPEEAGHSAWCRQVSRSSAVAGAGHQSEHDLTTSPLEAIVTGCPGMEEGRFFFMGRGAPGGMRVLSQITENRKVEARKSLILQHTIFTFGLTKATLRQNL